MTKCYNFRKIERHAPATTAAENYTICMFLNNTAVRWLLALRCYKNDARDLIFQELFRIFTFFFSYVRIFAVNKRGEMQTEIWQHLIFAAFKKFSMRRSWVKICTKFKARIGTYESLDYWMNRMDKNVYKFAMIKLACLNVFMKNFEKFWNSWTILPKWINTQKLKISENAAVCFRVFCKNSIPMWKICQNVKISFWRKYWFQQNFVRFKYHKIWKVDWSIKSLNEFLFIEFIKLIRSFIIYLTPFSTLKIEILQSFWVKMWKNLGESDFYNFQKYQNLDQIVRRLSILSTFE